MSQLTFSEAEYNLKKRKTRRERFLEQVEVLVPWPKLEKIVRRYYPKAGNGRRPYPLSIMLRIHCLQLFYNLSDPAMEDALYEIESMRRFAGLKITDAIPDETTILKFRHLLEKHQLGQRIFDAINAYLSEKGYSFKGGTIVDASIISAPTSTKNKDRQRDPEMHQTRKGHEWQFGMKVHVGVDECFGLIHSLATTSANVHDIVMTPRLLHGKEQCIWGDSGYTGSEKRAEHQKRKGLWFIAARPHVRKKMVRGSNDYQLEKLKAQMRAKVEHSFMYIKRLFGYNKVRYRGLKKNENRLYVLAGMSNLIRMKSDLLI